MLTKCAELDFYLAEFKRSSNLTRDYSVFTKKIGIKNEGEQRNFYGFTLLDNHIYGITKDKKGQVFYFVTALKPSKRGFTKFYMKPKECGEFFEWDTVEVRFKSVFVQYLVKVKQIYSTGGICPMPIAEQFERTRPSISQQITSGNKWQNNSVFGFVPDNKSGAGVATEYFTKEEKECVCYETIKPMWTQKHYSVN